MGTAVVLGVRDEVECQDTVVGGGSLALVLAKTKRAIQ
jgi:hypothetical protein